MVTVFQNAVRDAVRFKATGGDTLSEVLDILSSSVSYDMLLITGNILLVSLCYVYAFWSATDAAR